jgi:hypothetical protein
VNRPIARVSFKRSFSELRSRAGAGGALGRCATGGVLLAGD